MSPDRFIPVTRTFLPPQEEYAALLRGVWERGQVTNNGPLAQQLEKELAARLGLSRLLFTGNGTIAIQLAIKALELKGEIITTPYSYVATTSSVIWEGCTPVFVDIDPRTFCIDAARIEERITPRTSAILATHVYGLPCAVEMIREIATRRGLKVIYDAAHAFGTEVNGRSLIAQGDVSTLSFHATKLFHTVEGGAVVAEDPAVHERMSLLRSFGHVDDVHYLPGINAKNSEMHAAMGLCNLRYIDEILERRAEQWQHYASELAGLDLVTAHVPEGTRYNHAYFPIVLPTTLLRESLTVALNAEGIFPRRYFFPSLDDLPYTRQGTPCTVSRSIAERVICLPLYHTLSSEDQDLVCAVVRRHLPAQLANGQDARTLAPKEVTRALDH